MADFSFLHAADIHLDSPLQGLRRRVGESAGPFVDATRKAFENLVSLAIERKVAFVVLSGDIFDGDWRDFASGQFVVKQFSRLDRERIPVFLIRGNHDADNVVTKNLPLPANVTPLSVRGAQSVVLEEIGVAIHGRGFATRHVEENVVLAYPEAKPNFFNVGMLHTSLTGRDGHGTYAPCSLDDLKSRGYQYWALGHIHQRERVHDDPYVVYPGNVQGRHSKEEGAKGCVVVSVEDGKVANVAFHACDVVRFATVEIDATGVSTMDEVFERFRIAAMATAEKAEGRPLAIRARLYGATPIRRRFSAERRALEEGLQAVSTSVDAETLIEKVVDATVDVRGAGSAAVPHFDEALATAAGDDRFLASLAETLAALRVGLPADVLALLPDADLAPELFLRRVVTDAASTLSSGYGEGRRA